VDRADVEAYARDLEQAGRARSTVARRLATLAGFYRYAVEEATLPRSPVAHVRRPSVPATRRHWTRPRVRSAAAARADIE
jgi:site-specific recombinase XerD